MCPVRLREPCRPGHLRSPVIPGGDWSPTLVKTVRCGHGRPDETSCHPQNQDYRDDKGSLLIRRHWGRWDGPEWGTDGGVLEIRHPPSFHEELPYHVRDLVVRPLQPCRVVHSVPPRHRFPQVTGRSRPPTWTRPVPSVSPGLVWSPRPGGRKVHDPGVENRTITHLSTIVWSGCTTLDGSFLGGGRLGTRNVGDGHGMSGPPSGGTDPDLNGSKERSVTTGSYSTS